MSKRSDIDTSQSTKTAISSQKVHKNQNEVQNPQNAEVPNVLLPKQQVVPETATQSLKTGKKSVDHAKNESSNDEFKKFIDCIWQKMIAFLLWLCEICQIIFEYFVDICVKVYRIALFCYRKPQVAKDLICTTFHLLKVSYDAEIWSWTELFAVLKNQLIQPMTKTPPPASTAPKTVPLKDNKNK